MKDIVAQWPKSQDVDVRLSFGASGKFFAQIKNGAPFDIFLSADSDKPARLVAEGYAKADQLFTYGIGQLVLWSADASLLGTTEPEWTSLTFSRLAMANPRTAPYGQAAQQYINSKQLARLLSGKIVTGENIAQTFAFVKSANAQLGFIALSQFMQLAIDQRGSHWFVPPHLHLPIQQDSVLLNRGLNNQAAIYFFAYLQSAEVASIIQSYGYQTFRGKDGTQ
ncbi:molybdate-binding periplasmic protein ModA [Planctobacterium marinum]|uniref:Molybdate-binding periplasmic protein ModA n=2 Tax=Planctobacterium marinum TaxID=1631968 RepID=A0AA48KSV1_9ALTE|nr:molybdate-binding periplasmic protein ModA [Planctobacterium marinum]